MSISRDIDRAIEDENAKRSAGKRPKEMRLRMGAGALRALAVDIDYHGDILEMPLEYRGIPITPVQAPLYPFSEPTSTHFHGWELRA